MFYVYALLDPRKRNRIFYIGKSKNMRYRLNRHLKEAESGYNSHKCNVIRKIKRLKLDVDTKILCICKNNKIACFEERWWIAYCGFKNLTNLTTGGDTGGPGRIVGYKHSEETKEKLRKAALGRKHSEKSKRKVSIANKGKVSWIKGKHHSEEAKRKMSIAQKGKVSGMKGKKVSEKTKRKISASLMGHKVSKEARQKMSESTKKNFYCSDLTRVKLSTSIKKYWANATAVTDSRLRNKKARSII